ncbi:hypothetical protein [Streptomyces malaysiensis]|uniref:Uncharacterized protein n=1 Tax=Streptomyces malaysiensis subsp. samsunensis TaxID=459658 RepID=A0A9X2RX16_STRMQ|nr:hypothetical protein [Streptomyces samsunensis]MCQ8831840.1 hypothetical protein [Streptomyces samsunensis]
MTDHPYTNADLRATAAEVVATAIREITPSEIADRMDRNYVQSTNPGDGNGRTWEQLLNGDGLDTTEFLAARQQIDDLIRDAADVSEWAIQLSAASLTPHPAMAWQSTTGGYDVAVQVATANDLIPAARDELMAELRKAVGETVCRVLGLKPVA